MDVTLDKNPTDRVCECNAILRWAGNPAKGQYRHIRPDGQMYITTHAPVPRPAPDDRSGAPAPQSGYTPCACRDCMDTAVSSDTAQPELCAECTEAECEPLPMTPSPGMLSMFNCQRDDAYGE